MIRKRILRCLTAEHNTAAHVINLRARENALARPWHGKFLEPNGWRAKRHARLQYRRRSIQSFFQKNWPNSWKLI